MSSIGTGYDYSASTYSPDGRVFQVEYAAKAVETSGTCVGIRCKDGVVLAAEKLLHSKLLVPRTNKWIGSADRHIGLVSSGLSSDGRQLINRAREEAANFRDIYRVPIPGKAIASRIGNYVQAFTLYASVRPFGCSTLIGVYDHEGPQLYLVEPSGVYWGYFGCAAGKGKQVAKTELEKLKLSELTCREAVKEAARIIHVVHDDAKDKEFELEMSWICDESQKQHEMVPLALLEEANRLAKESLSEEMEDD